MARAGEERHPQDPSDVEGLLWVGRGADLNRTIVPVRRGLEEPLPPERCTDEGLFWSGGLLGERGLDLVFRFEGSRFVDRVILRQDVRREARLSESVGGQQVPATRPTGQAMEAAELQVTAGLGRVRALYTTACGNGLCLGSVVEAPNEGVLPDEVVLEVGLEATEVVLSLESFRRDVHLAEIEIWGGAPGQPLIYPAPDSYLALDGRSVVFGPRTPVEWSPENDADLTIAASVLREALADTPSPEAVDAVGPAIRLRKEHGRAAESYRLRVGEDGAEVVAGDRRGLIYGAAALAQLIAAAESDGVSPCNVEDEPKMGLRGVHLYMPSRRNIPFFKRLVRHLLAPMRYNTIILEVGAAMELKRHPEINQAWVRDKELADRGENPGSPHIEVGDGGFLSQAEVRDLVEYAEEYGVDVIPEIQSLSHVEFLTMAHPEIAENPADDYPDCYCPQNERSYEILFDIVDEVVSVFHPRRYMHMGHDEAYSMCLCDKCKSVPKAELFARDVNRIYEFVRGKGLEMMIWDDMVNTTRHFACPEALDLIPKDIVLLNFVWYDRMDVDTEDLLLDHGFPVMIGNFYSSHFPRFASREVKRGLVGAEVSTWCLTSEEDYGRVGKLYDFIYSANMMWSGHYRDELRRLYDFRISSLLPPIRDALSDSPYPSRLRGATCHPLDLGEDTVSRRDVCGSLGGYDLTALPLGQTTLEGMSFALEEEVMLVASPRLRTQPIPCRGEIPVARQCDSVVFLHTCTQPGMPSRYNGHAQRVARYAYVYDDGTRTEVTIEYGWQLAEWNRAHGAPLHHSHWRHSGYIATYPSLPFWQGKTPRGEDVTLYGYEFLNPYPDKQVERIETTIPDGAGDAALLLVAATAVCAAQ